jgi:hypothetical protein
MLGLLCPKPAKLLLCLTQVFLINLVAVPATHAQTTGTEESQAIELDDSLWGAACDGLSVDSDACEALPADRGKQPAKSAAAPQALLLKQTSRFTLRGYFQAGINGVAEQNVYWNLADTVVPPVDFDNNPDWLEGYIKPGLSFNWLPSDTVESYGKLSCVVSGTSGIDAFDTGNIGRGTIEDGYLGLRSTPSSEDAIGYDASFGPRELKLGTGMLIANGGQNGFERGSLKLGPRKAWEFAAIGRLSRNRLTTTLFYLDANELRSNDTDTTVTGCDLRLAGEGQQFIGTTYLYVPTSDSPYPVAAPGGVGAPTVLFGARQGLHAVNSYARITPFATLPDLFLGGDFAYEQNDRIDLRAWGGRLQVGKSISFLPFQPVLTYSFQTFSGDDPNTTRIERFDPLFFEGSPSSWSTGSKSALVFINSNVNSHQLALTTRLTKKDTVTFRYAHIQANELRSPLQFGQATRVELENGISTVIAGVVDPHVSDDFFIEYNRVINQNTFLTAGYSISAPGRGIELVAPGRTPVWPGGFINVVVNY